MRTRGWLLLGLFAVALAHFLSFDFVHQPILTDIGYYLYFAGQIVDGAVPYQDFYDYKTPLAMFAGAFLHGWGAAFGLDGVVAIRLGYLLLAACAAVAAGLAHARLATGRRAAVWMGLFFYCGFELLGRMPSIGNVPKQLVLLLAPMALLALDRKRYVFAGVFCALAGLDWQPAGLLVGAALLAGLLAHWPGPAAGVRIGLGLLFGLLPFLLYFGLNSALGDFWEQCVQAPFKKSESAQAIEADSLAETWARFRRMLRDDGPGESWILWLSILGMLLYPVVIVRQWWGAHRACLVGLAGWHYGVLAFSIYDFQGHADLFLLLGSLAFFAAVTGVVAYYALLSTLARRRRNLGRSRKRAYLDHHRLLSGLTWVLLLVALRPSFLEEGVRWVGEPDRATRYDLTDQREVARAFGREAGEAGVLCLKNHDLLVLGDRGAPSGVVFWHYVLHDQLRNGAETSDRTLRRLIERSQTEVVVVPERSNRSRRVWLPALLQWLERRFESRTFTSADGSYSVQAWFERR